MLFLCKNKAAVRACAQITGKEHTMKKLETVLAVTAAMILALSAAGCSSSSDDDDNETGGAGELVSKELEISETPQLLVKADELKNISSLTISITNIYTSESNWWFGIVDENGENYQEIKWKSGESSECIYELSITDFSTYSNGIYIKGVSSTVTVKVTAEEGSASQDTPSNTETPSDTDTSSGDGNSGTENGDEDSTGDDEEDWNMGVEIYSESITLSGDPSSAQIESSKLSNSNIQKIIITAVNFSAYNSDGWITLHTGQWNNKKEKSAANKWSDKKLGCLWEITDTDFISAAKQNGIFIAGTADATATITVSYQ